MVEEKHKVVVSFLLVILFGYLSYLIIQPFFTYVVLGFIFAFLFYPVYRWLAKRMKTTFSAIIVLAAAFLLVIIPSIWLGATLIAQASNAYTGLQAEGVTLASVLDTIPGLQNQEVQVFLFSASKNTIATFIPRILTLTGEVIVGLVILFFVFYYALKDGGEWYSSTSNAIPIKHSHKKRLQDEIERMTKVLFFGQVLTSLLVGLLCGVIFALFGVSNPVFWGFIMIVFAFLPFVGAPIIYLPAGALLMYSGFWFAGISVIVLCSAVLVVVEYVLRPKFVSKSAAIHPLSVVIGAIGGVYLLGFVGFLIGPLILNIFLTLASFDHE